MARSLAVVALLIGAAACDDGSAAPARTTTTTERTTTTSTSTSTTTQPGLPTGSAVGFAPSGPISTPTRVGPAAGGVLDGIDRDAGVSVQLRDGSTLWLFGDTAHADDNGALTYFVIGTAAWAAPGEPSVTRDHARNGEPVAFATPIAGFPPCPGIAPVPGMWPSSAVVQPVGDRDRVIVWLENICLGSTQQGAARGMAVAEWYYDPAAPPTDEPIQGRVLNQTLFPQRSFGIASLNQGDGTALTFACDSPEHGGPPEQYGPCRAASVDLDRVADPSAYRVWDGAGWNDNPMTARPLLLDPGGLSQYPAGSFSVAKDAGLGRYVMVYSPWPGLSDTLQVRVADAPTGPWSSPVTVPLPGCSDPVGPVTYWCYAAAAQPIFSSPGRLGVGYYDRRVSSDPVRGSYLVATIPYASPAA